MAIVLAHLLTIDILLAPPGLLIVGLVVMWRHWRWPWRAALVVPFALAAYAIPPIWTWTFGTNLSEYDGIARYILRIVAAYAAAALLFLFAGAARLSRSRK